MKKVERAAARVAAAVATLEVEIREEHARGVALRKIAKAAGVSHETVRRILSR